MNDDHHDNSYEDTGEITSIRAHIAYADWRGPDHDTFNPWWGELCWSAAEAERAARQQDKREAEEFFA